MTADKFTAWVERSRAAQGFPPKIEDEATLLEVAGMLVAAAEQRGAGGGGRAASA